MIYTEYTEKQINAIKALKQAFAQCRKVGLSYHNCYARLKFYPLDVMEFKHDEGTTETIKERDIFFEEIVIEPEWTDDTHFFQLTPKGKNKYLYHEK